MQDLFPSFPLLCLFELLFSSDVACLLKQVYDSYGRKCNSRFFVNYGFALDDNEADNEGLLCLSIISRGENFNE